MRITIVASNIAKDKKLKMEREANKMLEDGVPKFGIAEVIANDYSVAISITFEDDLTIFSCYPSLVTK